MACSECGEDERGDEEYVADEESLTEEEATSGKPIRARILWPALGFPAVITPREKPAQSWMLDADATRCVCVLLLSNRRLLSKEEVARHLRIVPWDKRAKRHIKDESFAWNELAVRNHEAGGPQQLYIPGAVDKHARLVAFGADREGNGGVVVTLANRVTGFYQFEQLKDHRLPYLHEIRVSEEASGRLKGDQYHLFWNNEKDTEDAPSDEMALLLRHFAQPRREKLGQLWKERGTYLMSEYEYEYESVHAPYNTQAPGATRPRAEVLHPVFVQRQRSSLVIGHLTDIHVDVRADVYEANLKRENVAARFKNWTAASYNHWNKNFSGAYADVKQRADILLLTGDLIDYGRGHWGPEFPQTLGQDGMYHLDRNWFLFYSLLASGERYRRPTYTNLGNHDWRPNPYPPFAPGAPDAKLFIHNSADFSEKEREAILRLAHGKGHGAVMAYNPKAKSIAGLVWNFLKKAKLVGAAIGRMILQARTMDQRGSPAETSLESVAWYLLTINPFFDYCVGHPAGHTILMLDWAEDEDVLFPLIYRGEQWPYLLVQAKEAAGPGPKASRCVSALQKRVLDSFIVAPGDAKIIGIHAPPVGPYTHWQDTDLLKGREVYDDTFMSRGPTNYGTRYADGRVEKWNGHPFFATRPKGAGIGVEADYGSFLGHRPEFFKAVLADKSRVRLVFSGHIHRNNLLVVEVPKTGGSAVVGQRRVWGIPDTHVRGSRPPAVSPGSRGGHGPLFVNTTSLGPRGHSYPTHGQDKSAAPGYSVAELSSDGTIRRVEFLPPMIAAVAVPTKPRKEVGAFVG